VWHCLLFEDEVPVIVRLDTAGRRPSEPLLLENLASLCDGQRQAQPGRHCCHLGQCRAMRQRAAQIVNAAPGWAAREPEASHFWQ